ncbi:hypothetical protein GCM10009677_37190 [Sphaerisporangium rubeum]
MRTRGRTFPAYTPRMSRRKTVSAKSVKVHETHITRQRVCDCDHSRQYRGTAGVRCRGPIPVRGVFSAPIGHLRPADGTRTSGPSAAMAGDDLRARTGHRR